MSDSEREETLSVNAGPHDRRDCPVTIALPKEWAGITGTLGAEGRETLPLQWLNDGRHAFLLPALPSGETITYRMHRTGPITEPVVRVDCEDENSLAISVHAELLTRYVYENVPARPYFYPLLAPRGVPVTRAYPMQENGLDERRDHRHHRSLWIAFGDVNGVDNWSEEPGHGHTRHQTLEFCESGPTLGQFITTSLWTDSLDRAILTQRLRVAAWGVRSSARILDIEVQLQATHGDVRFGDTKEGGVLSLRVASSMEVARGGRIENTYGAINEAEAWGKSAHWTDYSGVVGGERVGVAIMDHPNSFRYPTHWHVRDYGLMTANPFGYAAYTNGVKDGTAVLKSGDHLDFYYRLVVHSGDTGQGDVRGHYLNFAAPPDAEYRAGNKNVKI